MQGSSFTDWFSLSHNALSTDDWLILFFFSEIREKIKIHGVLLSSQNLP